MKIASLILSALAIVVLLTGSYFAYDNKTKLETLRQIESDRLTELANVRQNRDDELLALEDVQTQTASVEGTAGELDVQLADRQSEADELERGNEDLEAEASAQAAMVDEVKNQVRELGDIDEVVDTLQTRRTQLGGLASDIASSEGQIASTQARIDNFDSEIERLRNLQSAQTSGEMVGGFSSSVRAAFPNDGFVVIGGGYNRNVNSGADISIQRGGQQIALGEVTSVHADYSVVRLDASATTGSVAPGDQAVYVRQN